MIRTIHHIRINRPLADLFAFLEDPDQYPAWQLVMEHVKATNGMREGSLVSYTRTSELGDNVTGSIRITRNNGHDLLESVSVGGALETRVRFELKPDGPTSTFFTVLIESKPRAAMPREAETALEYIIDTRTQGDVNRLKQVVESRAPLH